MFEVVNGTSPHFRETTARFSAITVANELTYANVMEMLKEYKPGAWKLIAGDHDMRAAKKFLMAKPQDMLFAKEDLFQLIRKFTLFKTGFSDPERKASSRTRMLDKIFKVMGLTISCADIFPLCKKLEGLTEESWNALLIEKNPLEGIVEYEDAALGDPPFSMLMKQFGVHTTINILESSSKIKSFFETPSSIDSERYSI